MTEPTLESMNEAARAAGHENWREVKTANGAWVGEFVGLEKSIHAHALTLDKLHGRKEVSEAELFYLTVMRLSLGSSDWGEDRSQRGHLDKDAIALIEAKFAELRAPKEPEWIEWHGGECPVGDGDLVELKLRAGLFRTMCAGNCDWSHAQFSSDIIAYRVLT